MEEREKESGAGGCFIMGVIGFMVPVLYVLSIGPADMVASGNPAAARWLGPIYWPLAVLAEFCGPIGEALGWYVELWRW